MRAPWLSLLLSACAVGPSSGEPPAPAVRFVVPVDEARFDPLRRVEVCLAAPEGLSEATLTSDVDGLLATLRDFGPCAGGRLGVSVSLSDGPHVLVAGLTDAEGRMAEARVRVAPPPNAAPRCALLAPLPGVHPSGALLPLRALVEDDGPAPAVLATLVSDVDGLLWSRVPDGEGVLTASLPLSDGAHHLTLTVDDPRGLSSSCAVAVTLAPCVDADADGWSTCDGDCDDDAPHVFPGAAERPNADDDDCDGGVDEGTPLVDDDADGATELDGDCDDDDPDVGPLAVDTPDDGVDQDCSGADTVTCFVDADGDGVGGPTPRPSPDGDCLDPGESPSPADCDDANPAVFPGAPEVPGDGVDQDCSGADAVACPVDRDGDGVGGPGVEAREGACPVPAGDCDDDDAGTFPGAPELPDDGLDQDCSGADAVSCPVDRDGDGVGGLDVALVEAPCATPAGDCDDDDPLVHPGASDPAGDGVDADCDGADGLDSDGDGWASVGAGGEDCDDDDPLVHPGAAERRDGLDDDCDGLCDEGLIEPGELFVSELMINPSATDDLHGEWIELHNGGPAPIRLCGGWSLSDDANDHVELADPSLVVPPGGFLVLCAEADPALNGGVPCDLAWPDTPGMHLGNSGDEVYVRFDGLLVDAVVTTSGFDLAGRAQALGAPFDAQGNDLESSWCDATTPLPGGDAGTPGQPNDCP